MRTRLLPIWGRWHKTDDNPKSEPLSYYIKTRQLKWHLIAEFHRRFYCPHPERFVKTIWPRGTTLANEIYRKPMGQFCMMCFRQRDNLKRVKP